MDCGVFGVTGYYNIRSCYEGIFMGLGEVISL